jgi:hypothetical protein
MNLCAHADMLVGGPSQDGTGRQEDYGHPYYAFSVVADFWTTLLAAKGKLRDDAEITPEDVVQCMQLLKIQREAHKPKYDNRLDLAGYAQVLDLIVQYQHRGDICE